MTAPRVSHTFLERLTPQVLAVVAATIASATLHWTNDGLWFQGDAPRHVANGLFYWDLVSALPPDPLRYALSYYARYPVIAPVAYPPFFYLLEGAAFSALGASGHVAKAMVLCFCALTGIFTMLCGRRWIGPVAGWAGACTVLLPGFVRFSNAVLLNVPATAFGLAALYYFSRWLDTSRRGELGRFCVAMMVTVLTYFPGAIVIAVAAVWLLGSRVHVRSRAIWLLAAVLVAIGVVVSTALPVYLSRHVVPSLGRLLVPVRWIVLVQAITSLTGVVWLILGVVSFIAALSVSGWKGAPLRLGVAFGTVAVTVLGLRWMDPRYALILVPFTVLLVFLGLVRLTERMGKSRGHATAFGVIIAILLAGWSAVSTQVPIVSGFERVAEYLREHAPHDGVIYNGYYDGVFGMYLRTQDPYFERRLVLWRKLVSSHDREPTDLSRDETVSLIQNESGCQWVVVEVRPRAVQPLRQALQDDRFELVQSFPVQSNLVSRVDLYRFRLPIKTPPPVDLSFQLFSGRVFRGVEPIPSRR